MTIETIPGQYPDPIHQRFINHTRKTHIQIQCAFGAYRSWYLCIIIAVLGGIAFNTMLWWNPYYQFGPLAKVVSALGALGLIFVAWHFYAPCKEDELVHKDYSRVRKVLLQIEGFSTFQIEGLMEEYYQADSNGVRDARGQTHLSKGIHELLVRYAFRAMAHEGRDKKRHYWRTKFAQAFRVAVMLRLIPYWYETVVLQQSSNAWAFYFDSKTVGEGHIPKMDWGIIEQAIHAQTSA
jgi:hypothetical protein